MENKFYKKEIPFEFSDYALKKYFRDTGERQGWLPEDDGTAVLAVSGGGDSVALLWLFKNFFGGKISVVHVNHGIRENDSDIDENFVVNLASSFGVEAVHKKVSVPEKKFKGESIEAAARRLRIETICETAEKIFGKNSKIFLGHNRDDLAETVLFNILRGTGIRGSVGITECTELNGLKFYRPLLGLRRDFLREILRTRNIEWREDKTNEDDTYTRNFIRLKLLPLIESRINSSAVEHLAAFGEDMRLIRNLEDEQSRELLKMCREAEFSDLTLNRKILQNFTNSERALIIREAGRILKIKTLSRERCEKLADLTAKHSDFIFQWCGGVTVKGMKDRIIFERSDEKDAN